MEQRNSSIKFSDFIDELIPERDFKLKGPIKKQIRKAKTQFRNISRLDGL